MLLLQCPDSTYARNDSDARLALTQLVTESSHPRVAVRRRIRRRLRGSIELIGDHYPCRAALSRLGVPVRPSLSQDASPADQPYEEQHDGDDQQHMDERANGVDPDESE
jgi:hypothetical protein